MGEQERDGRRKDVRIEATDADVRHSLAKRVGARRGVDLAGEVAGYGFVVVAAGLADPDAGRLVRGLRGERA